jgi:ankyrin repeat protein
VGIDQMNLFVSQILIRITERDPSVLPESFIQKFQTNYVAACDLAELLTAAIKINWAEGVQYLIQLEVDINLPGSLSDITPLSTAVQLEKIEILKLLLQSKKLLSPCRLDNSLLHTAVSTGNIEIVRMLLKVGVSINSFNFDYETPLMIAAYKDNFDIIQILVNEGASTDLVNETGETALVIASRNGNQRIMSYLIPLTKSCEQKQLAEEAIIRGIELKKRRKNTWLRDLNQLIISGDTEHALLLISQGYDLNAFTVSGKSIIHIAAKQDNSEILNALIKLGVNLETEAEDDKYTPLMEAAEAGSINAIRILIDAGVLLNTRHNDITPLMIAADANRLEAVKILLKYGADPNFQDSYGKIALHYAEQNNYINIVDLLLDSGSIDCRSSNIEDITEF